MLLKLFRPLLSPWALHRISFLLMVGLASPTYRMSATSWVSPLEYCIDSLLLALLIPGCSVWRIFPVPFLPYLVAALLWGTVLGSLILTKDKSRPVIPYITLIAAWVLYGLGWDLVRGFEH